MEREEVVSHGKNLLRAEKLFQHPLGTAAKALTSKFCCEGLSGPDEAEPGPAHRTTQSCTLQTTGQLLGD